MNAPLASPRLRATASLLLPGAALAFVVACTPAGSGDGSTPDGRNDDPPVDVVDNPPADELVARAADALCGALYRCCPSNEELARFFAPITGGDPNGAFADLIPQLPPNAALTAEDCPALVAEIHTRKGIGPFARAAVDGALAYDDAAARNCLAALDDATCGSDVTAALFDSTCFALSAPLGGAQQRSMFARSTVEGACTTLADGFGGIFFGTCDPTASFCCVANDNGACGFAGAGDHGTCVPVSDVGEACSIFAPVQLCATGLECVPEAGPNGSDGCVAPLTTPLQQGEACYDEAGFRLLGECVDGWCDATGTNVCEARRVDGADCQTADQCISGGCGDGVCGVDSFCSGT